MFRSLIAVATLAAGLAFSSSALSQQGPTGAVCGERSKFLAHLGKNHQEIPSAMGVTAAGRVIEVLTSPDGTWTIIMTHPNGVTCLVAAGQAWETIERVALRPTT